MNAMEAVTAAEVMDIGLTEEDIHRGMERMHWQGRMETVLPGVILDGAHNDSGVEEFVKTARKFQKDTKLTLLFSCVKEKDYDGMIRTICESLDFESVVVTQIDSYRQVPSEELAQIFRKYTTRPVEEISFIDDAFDEAMKRKGDGVLFCVGSLYLVGSLKSLIRSRKNGFIELMATEPTIQDAPDAVELTQVQGRVALENVHFSYDDGSPEVLHGVDLTVQPGETVAIVGPSGGGKSTLCQLVPRFYDPDSGVVSVDGTDVRRLTQHSLRRAIGIVQQDVFLFADTIRENIRYGKPDASDAEVEEAARRAELYDDIAAMPNGFDTYVGERGTLLSGGQKQRVAIARIFLKDPPILILDEATSALDSITEAKIQHAFDELSRGRTTLIIAHRLSTIRAAHRILVIRDGRIAEQGTHQQLLAANGAYAGLYHTQNLGEYHG